MIRPMAIISVGLLIAAGLATYQVKHEVQGLEQRLRRTNAEIVRTQDRIHILNAEWSLVNDPERLRTIAERHLPLAPMNPRQFASIEELVRRLPVAAAPAEEAPQVPTPAIAPPGSVPDAEPPAEQSVSAPAPSHLASAGAVAGAVGAAAGAAGLAAGTVRTPRTAPPAPRQAAVRPAAVTQRVTPVAARAPVPLLAQPGTGPARSAGRPTQASTTPQTLGTLGGRTTPARPGTGASASAPAARGAITREPLGAIRPEPVRAAPAREPLGASATVPAARAPVAATPLPATPIAAPVPPRSATVPTAAPRGTASSLGGAVGHVPPPVPVRPANGGAR